ncbi:biotin carboxylase N-terminal domain-containing protein [Marmoricola sp. URHB0036]|uniref:acetyl/propionyl/methylcrotonyl-CoA carboxylase subunit alpha n=1 Tax=Marmoricola sp. URHB0036 TaxID=1298863 RepID=UPI000410FD4A|nr:biotin carboxylase N-terminal domain-containing protein [Marmoricola sp. URHB0036]
MQRLLIANRGEIARRIIRTARAMGIHTIAVHSEIDRSAPHVHDADEALLVESYLDIDAAIGAAQATGADAIHPGYGFLSERAAFAQAVEDAGLTLVGPSARVMEQMGRKDAARAIAEEAGVAVVPSYDLAADASTFDYPVLVKAAAGGGGKGMRIVRAEGEYAEALASAKREAAAAFGDDTMLIEKYVESGRHVEVQVLADSHGNVVHLFERDCSTQRRHQKVLEEAPAPTITAEQREEVTSAAVALTKQVGYENAGTVEFLLDNATGKTYFLEMNTRLQVEHPVTELVTGVDLVELQLLVASGEALPISQDDIQLDGHAIEARIYAEDSFGGFLPQAGTAELVRWPANARVDAALESGQVVSTSYDPMLGKVIAHGRDREEARRRLLAALDETAVLGFTTNVGFLRVLVATDEFRDATIDTAWLDRAEVAAPSDDLARTIAAWVPAMLAADHGDQGAFRSDGFRLSAAPAPTRVELDRVVLVDRARGLVDDVPVTQFSAANHVVRLEVAGRRVQAVVNATAHSVEVVVEGQRFVFERPDPFAGAGIAVGEGSLTAPMPGTVLAVDVAEGDAVEEGQRLGVLEAMKMELALKAPFAGTVTTVGAQAGEQVALKALLFEVTPDE